MINFEIWGYPFFGKIKPYKLEILRNRTGTLINQNVDLLGEGSGGFIDLAKKQLGANQWKPPVESIRMGIHLLFLHIISCL